jgi:aerobic carbon-monoxide dehydrogenase medium subunit
MKAPPFGYARPVTVEEAIGLLAEHGEAAKVLAGGQSLVPLLNFRLAHPDYLVDVSRLVELESIDARNGSVVIGATTTQREVERSPVLRDRCPLLAEAVGHIGHPQTRSRGTIGGSLAHADPVAELPAVVTALGGLLRVRGPGGDRTLAAGEFFATYLTTTLRPDELLTGVELPVWEGRVGSAFVEVCHRPGDFALVGAAASVTLDANGAVQRVGLALSGVGPVPFGASDLVSPGLVGVQPGPDALQAAADLVRDAVTPSGDIHAPAEYRRHLAAVLTRRALAQAADRAAAR